MSSIVFTALLFSLIGLLFPTFVDAQLEKETMIPDWFKNNIQWWDEGLIDDSDIIAALESLMIQEIIPLENFINTSGLEHQAGIPKQGMFAIPTYQKDVFSFWAEGTISDTEVVNSIGYLMSEGIINTDKIKSGIEKYNCISGESTFAQPCKPEISVSVTNCILGDTIAQRCQPDVSN